MDEDGAIGFLFEEHGDEFLGSSSSFFSSSCAEKSDSEKRKDEKRKNKKKKKRKKEKKKQKNDIFVNSPATPCDLFTTKKTKNKTHGWKRLYKRNVSSDLKRVVAYSQEWKCIGCQRKGLDTLLPATFEVDHVVPLEDGGHNTPDNLEALCNTCHSEKTQMERIKKFNNFLSPLAVPLDEKEINVYDSSTGKYSVVSRFFKDRLKLDPLSFSFTKTKDSLFVVQKENKDPITTNKCSFFSRQECT